MNLSEAHILLVDDEPMLRFTLGLVLRRQGATVTEAVNGAAALEVLQGSSGSGSSAPEMPVDLVLTDWHMPLLDGPALLKAMADTGQVIPAVLCTGTLGDSETLDRPSLGVQAVLLKPFLPTELLATLERVLAPLPARK